MLVALSERVYLVELMTCLRGEPFGIMVRTEINLWSEQCDRLMNNLPK